MKIYQASRIVEREQAGFPRGTNGFLQKIVKAELKTNDVGKSVLNLYLKDLDDEENFKYKLNSEVVYEAFMKDLKVKNIDDLVGKSVLAYISPNNNSIKGLGVRK